mgnify:CR=1 FL=1
MSGRHLMNRLAAGAVIICAISFAPEACFAQQVYASPELAMKDLIDSAKAGTPGFGERLFGKSGVSLLRSGNASEDSEHLAEFNAAAAEQASLDTVDDNARKVRVGKVGWVFPVPIVKTADGWRFDPETGREEILDRVVGYNELSAIAACKAYVKAQDEYFRIDRDNNDLREYAQRIVSRPGKRDGLYWEPRDQADISPLGEMGASGATRAAKERLPVYNGYRFRILTEQGPAAPGGAHPYLVNGHMISGHALVAWPDVWGKSGVLTFICGENGKVFQKNLGSMTGKIARRMKAYDPDKSWTLID